MPFSRDHPQSIFSSINVERWHRRFLEDGLGQVGLRKGARQVLGDLKVGEIDSCKDCSGKRLGLSRKLAALDDSACEIGTAEVGTAEVQTAEVGACQGGVGEVDVEGRCATAERVRLV